MEDSQSPLLGTEGVLKPPSKRQLALVHILGGIVVGYCTAISSGVKAGIEADWGVLSPIMNGLMTASVIFGAAIGSLMGGMLADKFGRQKSAIFMSFGAVLFSLAEACSPVMPVLIVARTLLGFCVGLISVICPLYVSELAPSDSRGFLGSFFQVSITFGIVLAYVAGFVLRPEWIGNAMISWRVMFGIGAFFGVFMLYVALFVMEESPVWLEQRMNEGALGTSKLKGNENTTLSFSSPFADADVRGWSGLFSRPTLLALSIGIVLAFDLQGTGINGIVFYLPELLQKAGLGNLSPILTIVVGIFNFLSTFFALFLVDRAGRKPLLLIGTTIMAISLLLVGISFYALKGTARGWFAFVAILLFHLGFEVGPGSLFWIIITEIFPTGVRSEANSFINLINNAVNLLVSLLFPVVFHAIQGGVFFFFSAMAVLVLAFMFFAYKENKEESPLQRMLTLQLQ